MNIINFILYVVSMVLFSCAVQSPPTGGPKDLKGPKIIKITPPNGTAEIDSKTNIEIFFNEMIDPKTIKSSINIFPNTKVKINSFGNKIIIKPKDQWPDNQIVKIDISRYISDFHGNIMEQGKLFTFSQLKSIPSGMISGKLFNVNKNISQINLYKLESDSLQFICFTQNDISGEFKFTNLSNGEYILVGIEGNSETDKLDIRKYDFGISSRIIKINDDFQDCDLNFNFPIFRKQIKSILMANQFHGIINFDDGSQIYLIDDNLFKSDFIESERIVYFNESDNNIFISLNNNTENYSINSNFDFSYKEIDKKKPAIFDSFFSGNDFHIIFSEPITISEDHNDIFSYASNDSMTVVLDFKLLNPMSLKILNIPESINEVNINNSYILDYSVSKNILEDSLILVDSNSHYSDKKIGSNIFGKIIYEGNNEIIVEAKNIHTKDTRQTVPDKYGHYKFHHLDVGYYQLWAYENINPINESYFNGLMEPLRLAASFGYYNEIIETRAKWDIEDIRIKIK